ncbi:SixA phosphatase family protein [Olivibacter ginsenosidimutans]
MKSLFLIRHAKSDWSNDLPDTDRPLNKRGQRDAPLMAQRLIAHQTLPQLLISSPANRAHSTAVAFAQVLAYPVTQIQNEDAIYEASVLDLLRVTNLTDDEYDCIALFGHNPGISLFAHYLCHEFTADIPTAAILQLTFRVEHWNEISIDTGKLAWYSYPKLV